MRTQGNIPLRTLPSVHCTLNNTAMSILQNGALRPAECKFYKEPLCYLFYGRPAYRVKTSPDGLFSGYDILPVALIFETGELQGSIKRVYPCDTGAYSNGLYKSFIGPVNITEWEIDSNLESIRRFVYEFYGTNKDYFLCQLPQPQFVKPPHESFYKFAQSLLAAISFGEVNTLDDRAVSIEIQISKKISVESLIGIIGPHRFIDNITLRLSELFEKSSIQFHSYPEVPAQSRCPSEYYAGALNQCLWKLLNDLRLL